MKSLVDEYNAASEETNQRVTGALAPTGEDLEANPRAWQTWWKEYLYDNYELESPLEREDPNRYAVDGGDYELPEKRPVYRYGSSVSQCKLSPLAWSCFGGSTPVWTSKGPYAIEKICPGDRVLRKTSVQESWPTRWWSLSRRGTPVPW